MGFTVFGSQFSNLCSMFSIFVPVLTPDGVVVGRARSLATDMDPLTGMFCERHLKSRKKLTETWEIPPLLSSPAE